MPLTTLLICASLTVVDGDTVRCDGQLLRLLGEGTPFVSGIDTPEMRGHCEREKELARRAKLRLKGLLDGVDVRIVAEGTDRTPSRRPLVNIYLPDGREVGQTLLAEGVAKEWRPDRRIDWCG
jgi:endonuclease YncB( thermonuclease family)